MPTHSEETRRVQFSDQNGLEPKTCLMKTKMSCHHSFVAITLKLHRRISFDIKCRFEAIPKTETDRRLVGIDITCRFEATPKTETDRRLVGIDITCRFEATPKTETDRRLVGIDITCRTAANHPAAMFDAEMCSFSAVSKANLPADFV